ncbi:hypothetical protein ABBQ32_012842 [Trebouxia sp. C0010 RCD-2024]
MNATDLPEEALLDVRGNHDSFDVPVRQGDWFSQYAAQGRRNGSSRVTTFPLYPQQAQDRPSLCAAAVLVGIDVSPQPGLRGPTNFAGLCGPALLAELDSVLSAASNKFRADGCSPAFLAYGHHPLSTILHPSIPFWRQIDRRSPATIYGKLSQHGVQTHLNGHLHSVFGQRIHKRHRSLAPGRLLELETAAWKDDRRFRLLTVDNGTFAFTDLMFNTPGKPVTKGVAPPPPSPHPDNITITGLESDVVVNSFIVTLTSPADARYSPLTKAAVGPAPPSRFDQVRALVLPITPDTVITKVEVLWHCAEAKLEGSITMKRHKGPAPLYTAPWKSDVSCGPPTGIGGANVVSLQVVASEAEGQVSSSEKRQVALKTAKSGISTLVTPRKPLPLQISHLEKLILWLDWTRTFNRLFVLQCLFHLIGMLLLPRALRGYITSPPAPVIPSQTHLIPATQSPANPQHELAASRHVNDAKDVARTTGSKGAPAIAGVGTQGGVLGWILWAPTVLCDLAAVPQIWWPLVFYSAYVPFGPWFAARFLSDQPLGLFFSQGVLLSPPSKGGGAWQWLPCADTLMVANRFTLFTMLPGTLWLAGVVSHWLRMDQQLSSSASRRSVKFKPTQLISLALLLAFHGTGLRFLSNSYGYSCLVLSPVMVWCVPTAAAMLTWLRYYHIPFRNQKTKAS